VLDVRARWLGHRLNTELDVALDGDLSLTEADAIAMQFEHELMDHIPALASARIRVRPFDPASAEPLVAHDVASHAAHHAPDPVAIQGELAEGVIEIIDTPQGERFRFTSTRAIAGLTVVATIHRASAPDELLELSVLPDRVSFVSSSAPQEPHEFDAQLELARDGRSETVRFHMSEPDDHHGH